MISDNLAPLFDKGQPGVRFRQGTVTAWDSETGENTIDLAGGTLTDVPIINTGEAIALKAGHVVGLLGQGSAWFIIGRITPPGSAGFASASVAFADLRDSSSNFALSTSFTTKVSGSFAVPAWADEALVTCTLNVALFNGSGEAANFAQLQTSIDGITHSLAAGGFTAGTTSQTNYDTLGQTHAETLTSLGSSIPILGQVRATEDAWANFANNQAFLTATAIFRSTV